MINIKCPWNCGFECHTAKQLHRHICDEPHSGIAMKLSKLIAKIQKEIEYFDGMNEYYREDYDIAEELKELLK